MKRIIILLALTAIFALFAVPALAQTKECTEEFKSAIYGKWWDNRQKDQPAAYEAAKEYLAVCTTDDQYTAALKKFKAAYEAATADVTNKKQFDEAYKNKNYAEQMRLGKAVLATEPDNAAVYIVMGLAGLSDPNLLNESAQYARKAIELIQAGKPVTPLFTSKDQALAWMNWDIARATLKSAPADAIPYLLKTAKLESDLKKDPRVYLDLAAAYNDGPQAKLTEEYKSKVGPNNTETPESKLVLENLNQVIDRQIDALARATALADAANKPGFLGELTKLYEYRNKSKAGVNELVANVLSKPLPEPPTPLTSLPTPPAPTAPAAASQPPGSTGVTQPGTTGSTKPATNTGSATGTGNGAAKPVATPTPGKKPRTNYRRP